MPDLDLVKLSRLQFATTALYHFLFVPLTLGLSWVLVIMESVYVMTGREIYRDMTRFWSLLFGINFVMGVTTGLTLEFQFGTNWAYYSHYVGDVFGVPLAVEGLMAFILESTMVGLFFFGWDRLGKVQHLLVTFLVALGSNLSALWILIANGWMQNPVGAEFNYETMRMELTDFSAVLFNPVAQSKFVHTVAAGYVTACMFVLGVSSWYLLRARDVGFAIRSFAVAAGFGLASALSVIVLGDESGYTSGLVQKVKLAAIEAEWETQPAPAAITAFGIPNQEAQRTDYAIKIPWLLGLIATRSVDEQITGIKDLVRQAEQRWLLRLIVLSIPLPWIAAELGWIVAEYGRQPWTISGVLPTFLSVSSLSASTVYASLAAFVLFYTALLVIEMYLMVKYIRIGPGSLRTGRYFGEASGGDAVAGEAG